MQPDLYMTRGSPFPYHHWEYVYVDDIARSTYLKFYYDCVSD